MTAYDRIKEVVNNNIDMNNDTIEKLIYLAYHFGREEATKEVSDKYNKVLHAQIERAEAEHCYNVAMRVQGNIKFVPTSDYAQDMINTFGNDATNI